MTAAGLAVSVATAVGVSALSAGALTASDSWISHLFAGNVLVTQPGDPGGPGGLGDPEQPGRRPGHAASPPLGDRRRRVGGRRRDRPGSIRVARRLRRRVPGTGRRRSPRSRTVRASSSPRAWRPQRAGPSARRCRWRPRRDRVLHDRRRGQPLLPCRRRQREPGDGRRPGANVFRLGRGRVRRPRGRPRTGLRLDSRRDCRDLRDAGRSGRGHRGRRARRARSIRSGSCSPSPSSP